MTPFACPVCAGRGTMPAGFYSRATAGTDCTPETCRSCGGSGIVWGVAPSLAPPPFPKPEVWPPRVTTIGTGTPLPFPEYEIVCDENSCVYRERPRD